VVEVAVQAVRGALAHMRDAEVGSARIDVGDVYVFGRGNTIRLSSAINSAVATSEGALAAAFALASAISAFATYLLDSRCSGRWEGLAPGPRPWPCPGLTSAGRCRARCGRPLSR